MKTKNKITRPSRGYTLVELLIVSGIVAAVGVGALTAYIHASRNTQTHESAQSVQSIAQAVHAVYDAGGNYDGLSASDLLHAGPRFDSANIAPNGDALVNRFGGAITLEPASAGAAFTLTTTQVPRANCAGVVAQTQSGFGAVSVNGKAVKSDLLTYTAPAAADACSKDVNTIVLTSKANAPQAASATPLGSGNGGTLPAQPQPLSASLPPLQNTSVGALAVAQPAAPQVVAYATAPPAVGSASAQAGQISSASLSAPAPALAPATATPPATCVAGNTLVSQKATGTQSTGKTQSASCPSGYTGSKTQTQFATVYADTYQQTTCPAGAWGSPSTSTSTTTSSGAPYSWQTTSNTCKSATPLPSNVSLKLAMWGGEIDITPTTSTASSYEVGVSCQPTATAPAHSHSVSASSWSQAASTMFVPESHLKYSDSYIAGTLSISSCTSGVVTYPVKYWVRACNAGGCSDWSTLGAMCSWNHC
ncbi:hypothetical protein GCM10027285_10940 [Oleiagrimonas citrea]